MTNLLLSSAAQWPARQIEHVDSSLGRTSQTDMLAPGGQFSQSLGGILSGAFALLRPARPLPETHLLLLPTSSKNDESCISR